MGSPGGDTISIAAAIVLDDGGRMLIVRKKNTRAFMQPGGKIDAGETPREALRRELREEIALDIDDAELRFAGILSAPAANEPDATVTAHTFFARYHGEVTPAAEIEAVHWPGLDAEPDRYLADLTVTHMIPLARQALQTGGEG